MYPLHDRESHGYNQLILNGHQAFSSTGCFYLQNFLTEETRSTILNEINFLLTNSPNTLFKQHIQHTENLYNTTSYKTDIAEPQSSTRTFIAFDQIPSDSLLRKLYLWDPLTSFVTDIIQSYPRLYRSCDELGALYVNVYHQSNNLSWHSDHSHFFVNLLLQQPSVPDEGIFEYQTKDNKVISRNDFQAGGLFVFDGRTYPHRVTEVRTSKLPRINAIFTYDPTPNHRLSDYITQKFIRSTNQNNK
ncbi:unnamed protein product [Rotaria socialis]|uniref:Fe2OG dioxygenase domain-containing protein n=1 Tax=Rotaria socialis TaxID=392032 RepID=A0A818KWJ4_9BILA|nr:unnamed protein product [Rotaria socialis]CAF4847940.1 unnamed protein product [Rotaria socialis]